jgi:hypothetical protein
MPQIVHIIVPLFYYLILLVVFGLGAFLVVGAVLNLPMFRRLPDLGGPLYSLLGRLGPTAVRAYFTVVGLVFSAGAIAVFVKNMG